MDLKNCNKDILKLLEVGHYIIANLRSLKFRKYLGIIYAFEFKQQLCNPVQYTLNKYMFIVSNNGHYAHITVPAFDNRFILPVFIVTTL